MVLDPVFPFWVILFVVTFGILLRVIWNFPDVFFAAPENAAPDAASSLIDLRWYTLGLVALLTALGGLIAVPLSILRNFAIERQTKTAEENLTTSLINTAVEGLGAQKTVSRIGRPVTRNGKTEIQWQRDQGSGYFQKAGDWQTFETTEPNLEVRIGAIYTLERIARDNPTQHIRIMDILCAYIRENSPASDAKDHGLSDWPDYPKNPTAEDFAERNQFRIKRGKELRTWTKSLPPTNVDIQTALTVIGSRSKEWINLKEATRSTHERTTLANYSGYRLDLRKSNLRRAELSKLNFAHAQFDGSKLEGATLRETHLFDAMLCQTDLTQANLMNSNLQYADLRGATVENSRLDKATMNSVMATSCDFRNSGFSGVKAAKAIFFNSKFEQANFGNATLSEAKFHECELFESNFNSARIQNAIFTNAKMIKSNLNGANAYAAFFGHTDLRYASFNCTNLQQALFPAAILQTDEFSALIHAADLRAALFGCKNQLGGSVGDEFTLLPNFMADGGPLQVYNKWSNPPPEHVRKFLEHSSKRGIDPALYWSKYVCETAEGREETGLHLKYDAPYPENHPLKKRYEPNPR